MDRIASLPRRNWQDTADVEATTRLYRTRVGTETLRPIQAAALTEAVQCGGLYLQARVGAGKTLVSGLLPTAWKCEHALIVVPSGIRQDTIDALKKASLHWNISRAITVVGYTLISQATRAEWLDRQGFDAVICDEAHKLKDREGASCAIRLGRFLRTHPEVKFACMTGSPTPNGEMLDFWHLLIWALRKRAPVPLEHAEAKNWSKALDGSGDSRVVLGARTVNEAQKLFAARLNCTPGVIVSHDRFDAVPLTVDYALVESPPELEPHFSRLRMFREMPDGYSLGDDPFQAAAAARQLALGFFYALDPRPSEEFINARSAWAKYVIRAVDGGKFDSEGEIKLHIRAGTLTGEPAQLLREWEEAKAKHPMTHTATWLSAYALRYAVNWLRENPKQGIVWVSHIEFGQALEKATGLPFYSGENDDRNILNETGERSVIASIQACGTGKNLQPFNVGLVMGEPANNGAHEQLLGRKHRDGQKRPVKYTYFVACREHWTAISKAIDGAVKTQTESLQPQKLYDQTYPPFAKQRHPAWFENQKLE